MQINQADICVIGGGPAGSVIAVRLAQFGYRVTLLEKSSAARVRACETLSPGIFPLLEMAGVRDQIDTAGFPLTHRVVLRWEKGIALKENPEKPGLLVDRTRFDVLLRESARSAGVQVLCPAMADKPYRRDNGSWHIPVRGPEGRFEVQAAFVVDASGKTPCLPGPLALHTPKTLAIYAQGRALHTEAVETRIEARPEGWLWGAPMPEGRFCVGFFVDPETLRIRGRASGLARLLADELRDSTVFSKVLDITNLSSAFACDATGYIRSQSLSPTSLCVGDAAWSMDPLSSQGVQSAITSALQGVIIVHTLLTQPNGFEAAQVFQQQRRASALRDHQRWTGQFYRLQNYFTDTPFWQARRRSGEPTDSPEPRESQAPAERYSRSAIESPIAPPSALTPVWFDDACCPVETPVIEREVISFRPALAHPNLPDPVAYVGQRALVPLLKQVVPGEPAGQLIARWSREMSTQEAANLFNWLWRHNILRRPPP